MKNRRKRRDERKSGEEEGKEERKSGEEEGVQIIL